MRDFYPAIEPFDKGHLKVSNIHEIYYEQAGNPQGVPVVFLHGGPGGGISESHRRFFDPQYYRIILFDQRGAGKSKPLAEIAENTTWELIKDIETLREHFKISDWHVFGGSWGSTLALAYAISHPTKVKSLLLRGIFLCRPLEIRWFYQEGASYVFPDHWEKFLAPVDLKDRNEMVKTYYKLLTTGDRGNQIKAAKAWSQWEAATAHLYIDQKSIDEFENPDYALSFSRIECHYFINNAFFPTNNYLLENIAKISHIPCHIVQGRYDMVCPARSAWELKKLLPAATLEIITDAGHSAMEPGIRSALIEATDRLRKP